MINISKGDILAEPLEFLIEILIRMFGKAAAQNFPNEPIEHWGMSQALWIIVFLGVIVLAFWVNSRRKKKGGERNTKLLKYIPNVTLFLLGLVVFLSSRTTDLPSEERLTKVTGNLMSVKSVPIGKHSLTMLKIEGQEILFSYLSMGRSCGNVYDKLVEKQGENITVKFDAQDLVKSEKSPNYYNIYDIWSGNYPICTYWDISEMYEKEYGFGVYFGLGMMLLSVLSVVKVIPATHASIGKD